MTYKSGNPDSSPTTLDALGSQNSWNRFGVSPSEMLVAGLGLFSTLGVLGIFPLLIGAYVEAYALSLRQAGVLITIEVVACVATQLAAVSRTAAAGIQTWRIGGLLAGFSYLGSAFLDSFWILCALRFVAGIGIGLIGTVVAASVARAKAPERLYAAGMFVYGAMGIAVFLILPMLSRTFGYWINFVFLSVCFLLTATLRPRAQAESVPAVGVPSSGASTTGWLRSVASHSGALLLGYFMLWIAFSMIWTFAERKGASIGMNSQTIGVVLAASSGVGLLGSMFANLVSLRLGRSIPILLGGLVLALSFCIVGTTGMSGGYVAGMLLYGIAYYFMLPYIFRVAADIDRAGRLAVVNSLMPFIAHMVSPLLGAAVIVEASFSALGVLSATISIVAVAFVIASSRSVDRRLSTCSVQS